MFYVALVWCCNSTWLLLLLPKTFEHIFLACIHFVKLEPNVGWVNLLQALAVLLVHYYSGLQDCAEQIEKGNYSTLKRNSQNADFDGSSNHQLEGSTGGTWDNEPSVKLDQQSTDSSSMDSSSLEQQVKPMSDPVAIPHTVSPSLKNS